MINGAIRYFLLDVCYLCGWVRFFSPLHNTKRAHSPEFFQTTYGFGPGIGGLAYTGLGLGFVLATIFGAKWADQVYKYVRFSLSKLGNLLMASYQLADKNGGKGTPEMRIPALFFGSLFVPVGLL